jgi:hypothetical protein
MSLGRRDASLRRLPIVAAAFVILVCVSILVLSGWREWLSRQAALKIAEVTWPISPNPSHSMPRTLCRWPNISSSASSTSWKRTEPALARWSDFKAPCIFAKRPWGAFAACIRRPTFIRALPDGSYEWAHRIKADRRPVEPRFSMPTSKAVATLDYAGSVPRRWIVGVAFEQLR